MHSHSSPTPTFSRLAASASGEQLEDLCSYISDTWVDATTFTPKRWSVYGQAIRTNNDTEGWHRRLNGKAKRAGLELYLLIELLGKESAVVSLQVRQVSENIIKRHQRKTYKNIQGKLFALWDQYDEGKIKASRLLRECSRVYVPEPAM